MINKRQLSTEELREKFLYLTQTEQKAPLNESVITSNKTSKLLKYEKMSDGKVYGIVQEGQKFYVKVCSLPKSNVLNVSDFAYLGGSSTAERLYERFDSYNKALNRFNGKKIALNETFGRLNESTDLDEESDKDVVDADSDSKRRSIKVTFDNGDIIHTEINGTEDSIKKYYIGKTFNLGSGADGEDEDRMTKGVKVEFLDESDKGEVNEEIPLNKDVDAKKSEVIVPKPEETTTPVETPSEPISEPAPEAPVEDKPATDVPAETTEPEPVDNTDLADYNPENPTSAEPVTSDAAPESTDAPAADNGNAETGDSTDSGSEDTVSEIQSLLGKLGAEFRKLPEVDATTAKSAINNIISSTKSGIEKLDDKDKEDIKKRIDKNGEKMDEEVESTEDELDAETINEIKELCGVENQLNESVNIISKDRAQEIASNWHGGQRSALYSFSSSKKYVDSKYDDYIDEINSNKPTNSKDKKELSDLKKFFTYKHNENKESDAEKQLNEAIKTPYGRFIVKKLIKEELTRYQSDDINENDDKKEVEGGYYRFNPSTKTYQTTMVNKNGEPYPGEEFSKEDDAVEHLRGSKVQESKYQKYLNSKKTNLDELKTNNPTPDIQKQFDDEENEGLPTEIIELYKKGLDLVRTYKNSKKEHYYPMIIEIVRKLRNAGHTDKAKKLLQMANQAIPKA